VKKQRAPVLRNSTTFQQPWDSLGSRLIESAQGNLLYTQEARGSSPLPPSIEADVHLVKIKCRSLCSELIPFRSACRFFRGYGTYKKVCI